MTTTTGRGSIRTAGGRLVAAPSTHPQHVSGPRGGAVASAGRVVLREETDVTHRTPPHPQHPVTHPQWCDPRCCHPTDVDTAHRSTPTALTLTDGVWQFQLIRADEHTITRPGETELLVDVTDTCITGDTEQYVLRIDEISRLCDRLTTEAHRARFLSTPALVEPCLGDVA